MIEQNHAFSGSTNKGPLFKNEWTIWAFLMNNAEFSQPLVNSMDLETWLKVLVLFQKEVYTFAVDRNGKTIYMPKAYPFNEILWDSRINVFFIIKP